MTGCSTSKKVLVSPGYGAGFATWAHGDKKKLAEDPELIAMVEAGTQYSERFRARAEEICSYVCLGGVSQLVVEEVTGPYRIEVFDGCESIELLQETDWG